MTESILKQCTDQADRLAPHLRHITSFTVSRPAESNTITLHPNVEKRIVNPTRRCELQRDAVFTLAGIAEDNKVHAEIDQVEAEPTDHFSLRFANSVDLQSTLAAAQAQLGGAQGRINRSESETYRA